MRVKRIFIVALTLGLTFVSPTAWSQPPGADLSATQPSPATPDENGMRKEWGEAQADVKAKEQTQDKAYLDFKSAEKNLRELSHPKPGKAAPRPEVLERARQRVERAKQNVTQKTLAVTSAKKRLAALEHELSQATPPDVAPIPNMAPVGRADAGVIADLEFQLGPTYYRAVEINKTLSGFQGLELPEVGKNPRYFEDPFEAQYKQYQDRYDSDRLAERKATPKPVPPTGEPVKLPSATDLTGTVWTSGAGLQWHFQADGRLRFVDAGRFPWPQTGAATWNQTGNTVVFQWKRYNADAPKHKSDNMVRAEIRDDLMIGTWRRKNSGPGYSRAHTGPFSAYRPRD